MFISLEIPISVDDWRPVRFDFVLKMSKSGSIRKIEASRAYPVWSLGIMNGRAGVTVPAGDRALGSAVVFVGTRRASPSWNYRQGFPHESRRRVARIARAGDFSGIRRCLPHRLAAMMRVVAGW